MYQRGLNSSTIRQKVSMCGEMDIWFGLVLVSVCVTSHTRTSTIWVTHARTHYFGKFWIKPPRIHTKCFQRYFQQTVVERGAIVRCICVCVYVSVCVSVSECVCECECVCALP